MRILISGSAGFIGSHLSNYYLARGDEVVGIDNFCTSSSKSEHFLNLKKHKMYTHLNFDISDTRQFAELEDYFCWNNKFDLILNFACPASPPQYERLSLETIKACTIGVMNILDLAKQYGPHCKVIHASTSEVYGDPFETPQNERYWGNVNSYGPRSCYDEGKRLAESICYEYRSKHNVDVRIIRIFNTYGNHMSPDDGRVMTNFIKQALLNQPITIYGDGKQTRSFCYVDDLIEGIVKLADLAENDGTPINLGNPDEYTISYLASAISEIIPIKTSHRFNYLSLPINDPTQRKPDIRKANDILNWNPKISLAEGIEKMVIYMKKVLSK